MQVKFDNVEPMCWRAYMRFAQYEKLVLEWILCWCMDRLNSNSVGEEPDQTQPYVSRIIKVMIALMLTCRGLFETLSRLLSGS